LVQGGGDDVRVDSGEYERGEAERVVTVSLFSLITFFITIKIKNMEQITGRLTADAKVNTVNGDKQVVNFSIAVNDR